MLCGEAAFPQGLRCAKLCRTSDEPCTLARLSAPTSSCSLGRLFPSVLPDASWQDAAQHCLGASAAQIRCVEAVRTHRCTTYRTQRPRRASPQPCGGHPPSSLQPPRRRCAQAMGFGAGDIKDKFRTYDGDADKRLRKKLEQSGKFDESFKTPVRISASRRFVVFSLLQYDSCPSHDDVGGFFFEFE